MIPRALNQLIYEESEPASPLPARFNMLLYVSIQSSILSVFFVLVVFVRLTLIACGLIKQLTKIRVLSACSFKIKHQVLHTQA
jgi:hypothetical protein